MMEKHEVLSHFAGDFLPFFRRYLPDVQKNGQGYKARCPFHEDHNPSLSIEPGTGKFFCHGCNAQGDILSFYARLKDLDIRTDFNTILDGIAGDFGFASKAARQEVGRRVHNYPGYRKTIISFSDDSKTAFFERYDNGIWIKGLGGLKQTLYNPEALKQPGIKFLSESEKDADCLGSIGFSALSFGGAENWRPEYADLLAGHEVVIPPHNDEPGRKAGDRAARDLTEKGCKVKVIPSVTWGPHKGADVADWLEQYKDKDEAGERLSVLVESVSEYQATSETRKETRGLTIIDASAWLETEPKEADQIIEGVIDAGDKAALIGGSKTRKTFLLLMLLLCLAAGRSFLNFMIPKPRRVLLCQLEIRDHHYHRRVKRMARALGITHEDLRDRFQIINGRGLGISGPEGIARIMDEALRIGAEVVAFDPLYKISEGNENDKADQKKALDAFDIGAERTGAAIVYVHHDAKGSPGDRDIRDRGAGSNVLGRDYDACITLTAHAQDPDAAIIELLLRNYPPQDPFTVMWTQEENGGYCFEVRQDILPEKKTSKTRPPQPPLTIYLPISEAILGEGEMEIATFKAELKTRSSLSDHRIKEFLRWGTAGENPYILTRDYRAYGLNKKWVKVGRRVNDAK